MLAVFSYALVALLVNLRRRVWLRIPNWVLIAVVGSTITFLSVNLISDVQSIWRFRNSEVVGYASGAIKEEIIRVIISTMVDSAIALPIMGGVHYIARKIKPKWRPTKVKSEGAP
jgi:hypothetical protein